MADLRMVRLKNESDKFLAELPSLERSDGGFDWKDIVRRINERANALSEEGIKAKDAYEYIMFQLEAKLDREVFGNELNDTDRLPTGSD